jgi:HAD superfamily hydrolase (TIGR01509 family)
MVQSAVLFDLDGVLVDACDWHYLSLNRALEEVVGFSINREEHITTYNGLPTTVKLKMLGLDEEQSKQAWKLKQDYTLDTIRENGKVQEEKIELFEYLKGKRTKIVCVTNSIARTTLEMLQSTGQFEYFDMIVTNEDVENNKPHPDCYNLAVEKLNIKPSDCIIVEDSPKGMESAKSSVVPDSNIWNVKNTTEVTLENFRRFENENFNSNGG